MTATTWLEAITAPSSTSNGARDTASDSLSPIREGYRVSALVAMVGRMRDAGMTVDEIGPIIEQRNAALCNPALTADELAREVMPAASRFGRNPTIGIVQRDTATEDVTDFRIRLVDAVGIEPENVDWAWDGRVPLGMLTLIVGEGGKGKSMGTHWLAAGFSRGTVPGALFGTPVHVALASAEDHRAATIVPRLIAAGADMRYIHFVEAIDAEGDPDDIAIDGQVADLEAACKRGNVRVLIVDTVVAHIPTTTNTWNEQHVRAVLKPLAHMAERLGLSVVGVMHLNRREAKDVLTRISGSGGFGNLARSVLLFGDDPREPEDSLVRILAHAKTNVGRLQPTLRMRITEQTIDGRITTAHLVADGESELTTAELLTPRDKIKATADGDDLDGLSAQDKAERFLNDRLHGRPDGVSIKAIKADAAAHDIFEHTLRRAREALDVDVFAVEGTMPAEWRYRLLDPDPTAGPRNYQTDRQTLAEAEAEAEAGDAA